MTKLSKFTKKSTSKRQKLISERLKLISKRQKLIHITTTELEKGWLCARASKRLVEIRPAPRLKSGKRGGFWDKSGGHRNRPIQPTEILNIPKFSVWQIRKNARSHAWIAWSVPTLKSTRKSGRHYSRVTQCVPAWPWPVQDVCRLLQVTSITGNQLCLILIVLKNVSHAFATKSKCSTHLNLFSLVLRPGEPDE